MQQFNRAAAKPYTGAVLAKTVPSDDTRSGTKSEGLQKCQASTAIPRPARQRASVLMGAALPKKNLQSPPVHPNDRDCRNQTKKPESRFSNLGCTSRGLTLQATLPQPVLRKLNLTEPPSYRCLTSATQNRVNPTNSPVLFCCFSPEGAHIA